MKTIKTETNARGEQVVSGRIFHKQLGVNTRFDNWILRKIKTYGFVENVDFVRLSKNGQTVNGGLREVLDDYILTLDMAKELAMITNTEKGRKIRRYFIKVEKEYNEKLRLGCTENRSSLGDIFKKNNEIARVLVANGVSRRTVMKAVLAKTQAESGEDLTPFLSILDEMPDRLTSEQAILNSKEQWNNG